MAGLDEELRTASFSRTVTSAGRLRLTLDRPYPLTALAAACSPDGRLRERAVRSAAVRTDPGLLPVLLIRTADWVAPVRERARRALAEALADPAALSPGRPPRPWGRRSR